MSLSDEGLRLLAKDVHACVQRGDDPLPLMRMAAGLAPRVEKRCVKCGKVFEKKRSDAKTCSDYCRVAMYLRRKLSREKMS